LPHYVGEKPALAARLVKSTAYQGSLDPFAPPPRWIWPLSAVGCWLAAGFLAASFIGYKPAAQGGHFLGAAGQLIGGVFLQAAGGAAWALVGFLVLAGAYVWREKKAAALVWLAAGGLWLMAGLGALLGFFQVKIMGGHLPLGGEAGAALAAALSRNLPAPLNWLTPGLVTALGLGAVAWSMWPVLTSLPDMLNLPGLTKPKASESEPSPLEESEAEAPFEPEPLAADEPAVTTPVRPEDGPRIKPRLEAPKAQTLQQEKLSFGNAKYRLPTLDLLQEPVDQRAPDQAESLKHNSRLLEKKLADFGVQGQVVEVAPGPVVTMYEFQPAPGVKISKVAGLSDDLAMNLRASSIRIVAPIPGKAVIGIEIPNNLRETVYLRELLASPAYQQATSPLTIALGKDILGMPVVNTLTRMPHLLIAGATGAGKSVFINTLVLSILYKASPEEVRLLLVDPKRIELSTYNDIPHLLYPIITNPQEATAGLRWAVAEMERRYELLARLGVRNIKSFNQRLARQGPPPPLTPDEPPLEPLPYVVIIIDELADLMMVSSKEVEALITRLAQMARAAGIHLVLATQRPSVDVITGLIKANFPARISFKVTSRVDSRTILDQQGAEHLLGLGDMLFSQPGVSGLSRLHGAFVSDIEIDQVVKFVKEQAQPQYDESVVQATADENGDNGFDDEEDERYLDAVALVKETGQASISYVQRRLRVGYNRAARMIEQMEREGIVGPSDGSKPRQVLIRE
jgi:S-DNA-T family DNA segregation ATPase FtsK/SpoIIIE